MVFPFVHRHFVIRCAADEFASKILRINSFAKKLSPDQQVQGSTVGLPDAPCHTPPRSIREASEKPLCSVMGNSGAGNSSAFSAINDVNSLKVRKNNEIALYSL
jgi:hypothetical protein